MSRREWWGVVGLILGALGGSGIAGGAEPEPFFPIMAWSNPPDDLVVLRRMRECGLTVAGFVRPEGLDHCHEAGLKAIVADERTSEYDWRQVDPARSRARVAELVARVKSHPAVYGYLLRDEPAADLFPGLATVADAIRDLHPGAWPYINLFPNYAAPEQLAAPSYDAYLDRYLATCRPTMLSYDHYALLEGGKLRPGYFANLAAIRRQALGHKLPFSSIVLAVGHMALREPSAADLRFQVYTSLAYGARGIAYFTYLTPPVGNFRMAAVDAYGHETATWPLLREVNLALGHLAPTLLRLRSDRVYHLGDKLTPECEPPDDQALVQAVAGSVVVGDFTHEGDGTRYVLIVNKDLTTSTPCQPRLRAGSGAGTGKFAKVSPITGQLVPFEGEETWLAPGQGVLLKCVP